MKTNRPAGVGIASLFGIAKDHGWQFSPPRRFKSGSAAAEYFSESAPAAPAAWPNRKPLPAALPAVTPLPLDSLPAAFRPWVMAWQPIAIPTPPAVLKQKGGIVAKVPPLTEPLCPARTGANRIHRHASASLNSGT